MTDDDQTRAIAAVMRVFPDAGDIRVRKRKCKLCEEMLVFATGPKGKVMVFDAKTYTGWYIDDAKETVRPFKSYRPHHATCAGLKK